MININDFRPTSLLFPFHFNFHVFLKDTYFYLMAFRAGTDSAMSFIIPTYVLLSFYNIIYVERKEIYYRREDNDFKSTE